MSINYFKSQSPACFHRCISVFQTLHFIGHQWIVSRVTHDGHTSMIFGCCSQQSYTTCRRRRGGGVSRGSYVNMEKIQFTITSSVLFSSTYQCQSAPRHRPQWHWGLRRSSQMDRGCTPPLFWNHEKRMQQISHKKEWQVMSKVIQVMRNRTII